MLQVSFPLGSRSLTVYGLTQYDYGQELEVHGLPLPAVVECQISLQRVGGTTESLAGVVVDDTLTLAIPDTYLAQDTDSDYTVYVYIYVTTETSGTTVYLVSMPVTARSMPDGYVPGETSPFAAVIDEMRELVEDAQDAATLSESYAKGGTGTRTGEDTDNSKYYSEEARDAEAGAADSAAEALASETAAAGSASTAAAASASAAEAKTAAEAAQAAATAKATEAANSASAAGVSAAAASASETAAGTHASTAGASAVSAASSASAAGSSATSAASSASSAESSATAAAAALGEVATAKQDALNAISGAQTTAVGAVAAEGTTQVAAVTAEGTTQKAAVQAKGAEAIASIPADYTELSNDVSELKSDKADKDGTYSTLTAGNLATEDGANNNMPYLFRASGGGVRVGEREYDKIVGGTVAWNQLVQTTRPSASVNGITFTNNGDGTWTVSGTATGDASHNAYTLPLTINNHVIYFRGCPDGGANNTYRLYINGLSGYIDYGNGVIAKPTNLQYPHLTMHVYSGVTINKVWTPETFDLTQMFGTTIADYIYSLESGTAGAGIAKLKEWGFFSEDYYAYNAGELKSVEGLTSHDMVGFNQFNPVNISKGTNSNYNLSVGTALNVGASSAVTISGDNPMLITNTTNWRGVILFSNPLINGRTYRLHYKVSAPTSGNVKRTVYFVDNNNVILYKVGYSSAVDYYEYNQDVTALFDGARLAFAIESSSAQTITLEDVCINLSDPAKNGTYEPYVKHTYTLDDSLTLRGIPKLDANNGLYYDGDTYESDGTVTRRYGIVDLGTLTWTYYSNYAVMASGGIASVVGSRNLICTAYPKNPADASNSGVLENGDKWITCNKGANSSGSFAQGTLFIKDSAYTDGAVFKSAMSGVYLVYELATYTSETAEPFAAPQIVDQYGTEEYVTTGIVPVGHETFYPENLRQKIEGLPWNFASLIAPTEVAYKATQNYTTGSLFIVNNTLYKATANIANGGAITPGTNCQATTLAAVIAAL